MTHKKRTHVSFDFAIKFLFRQKAYHHILEGFLTCLLDEPIKIVEVLESESNKENEKLKITRVDIVVKTAAGEIIILEHQHNPQSYFLQRAIFGVSRFLIDNLPKGDQYDKLKRIVSANILDFELYPGMTDCVYELKAQLVGRHDRSVFDISVMHNRVFREGQSANQSVFPAYYFMIVGRLADTNLTLDHVQQWAYFLEKSTVLSYFDAPGIQEAAALLQTSQLSFEELKMWNQHEADLVMQEDIINTRIAKIRTEKDAETNRADSESNRADSESNRADSESNRADSESNRADSESNRADSAEKRNGKAIMHLLELGRSVKEVVEIFNLSESEINKIVRESSSDGDANV